MIRLQISYNINDYITLANSIHFEYTDVFLSAMNLWCQNTVDPNVTYWDVQIALYEKECIGITGLYSLHNTPQENVRLGWFGISEQFKNKGFGSKLMTKTIQLAKNLDYSFLFVHTEEHNTRAIQFYQKSGFELLGQGKDLPKWMSYEPSDVVLKKILS